MKDIIKDYLFAKNIFVKEDAEEAVNQPEVVATLAKVFGVALCEGAELATLSFVRLCSRMLGHNVPEPFYRGFPQSVKTLSKEELLIDQLWHYLITYGIGDFSQAGHSILEEPVIRKSFAEHLPIKPFRAITESEAIALAKESALALLSGTRPLSQMQYSFVYAVFTDYRLKIDAIACKQTAVDFWVDTGKTRPFARGLWLSDTVKVVETMLARLHRAGTLNSLSLKTRDKKRLCRLLDYFFENGRDNVKDCYEKKAFFAGLLHHIHYKPVNERAEAFLIAMRGKENRSVYSAFEAKMAEGDVLSAALVLKKRKGDTALLRQLFYILSRTKDEGEIKAVLDLLENPTPISLWQLLIKAARQDKEKKSRSFTFHRNGLRRSHTETEEERERRKSLLPKETVKLVARALTEKLKAHYKGKLGKVYIDPAMKNIALPFEESTSMGGYGTLPTGSRVPIPEGKKLRCFVYWEKVDDIDLSCIGLSTGGESYEFSWRTMYYQNGDYITFSGDETSGYKGGSEYYDVDIPRCLKARPEMRYLVYCGNVYSGKNFGECICKGGYMLRDEEDSGEVFEPKTVGSSFLVNCASTEAYFFALDLKKRELVWLNKGMKSHYIIAAGKEKNELLRYMDETKTANMHRLFSMLAGSVVKSPERAEVVVSDETLTLPEGVLQIRSSDMDKVVALLNS